MGTTKESERTSKEKKRTEKGNKWNWNRPRSSLNQKQVLARFQGSQFGKILGKLSENSFPFV